MNGPSLSMLSSKNGMVACISRSGFFLLFYVFRLLILFHWRTENERGETTETKFAVAVRWCQMFISFVFYLMLVLIFAVNDQT